MQWSVTIKTNKEKLFYKVDEYPGIDENEIEVYNNEEGKLVFEKHAIVSYAIRPIVPDHDTEDEEDVSEGDKLINAIESIWNNTKENGDGTIEVEVKGSQYPVIKPVKVEEAPVT